MVAEVFDEHSERILEAARTLLSQHGLRRTSLADIADAAGVSQATLYRRFAGRDELLNRLIAREVSAFVARVDEQLEGIEDPVARLVAAFVMFVRALRHHDLVQRLIVTDPQLTLPALTTRGGGALALGREYVLAQVRAALGDAPGGPVPEQIAELMVRVAHSLLLTAQTTLPVDDDHELAALARAALEPLFVATRTAR